VALFAMCAAPAFAEDQIAVNYEISVGGARVMKASYSASISDSSYSTTFDAKSVGVTKWLSKIRLNLVASGRIDDGVPVPANYRYARKKNDKIKKRNLAFSPDGELVTKGTDYEEPILAALNNSVLDPLTMVLKLTRSEKPCSGKHRAFDGRDVFDVKLSKSDADGGKVTCKFTYVPVAGGDVESGETDPVNYEIMLAPLGDGNGYIAVRITGSTKGVGFEASAGNVTLNGQPISY
jgi:hypothetical protein